MVTSVNNAQGGDRAGVAEHPDVVDHDRRRTSTGATSVQHLEHVTVLWTTREATIYSRSPSHLILFIIPAKARDYVFTGVGLSVCLSVCLFVCYHDN